MPLNPTFATGIDISQHNGSYDPSVKPVDFVIARATIGLRIDARFRETAAKDITGVLMAYHYYTTNSPWKWQADLLLNTVRNTPVTMLFWDYEPGGNTLGKIAADNSVAAMSYLKQQSGKPVGLYADRQRAFDIYRDAPASRGFPLWMAQYYTEKPYWDRTPNIEPLYKPQFPNGVGWLLWQYASEKNWLGHDAGHEYGVESHSIDLDVWRGTKEQMLSYLGLWDNSPTEPTDKERLNILWEEYKKTHP